MSGFNGGRQLRDLVAADAATLAIRNLYPSGKRKWGMLITIYADGTPANNNTWYLKYNQSSTSLSDNSNWVLASTIFSAGGGGPTSGNGTTVVGTAVNWGGVLTQNVAIDGLFNVNFGAGTPIGDFTVFTDNNKSLLFGTQLAGSFYGFSAGSTAGDLFTFIDARGIKKGIQYAASGYETDDLTLVSRGFSNGAYYKVASGATLTAANTITGPTLSALPAGVESIQFNLNFSQTKQFSTGAIAQQREILAQAPTYSFVGASTITDAATWVVNGAPVAGTNATITRKYGAWIIGGIRSDGNITSRGVTLSIGTEDASNLNLISNNLTRYSINSTGVHTISQSSVAGSNNFININQSAHSAGVAMGLIFTAGAHTNLTASNESVDITWNMARTVQFATGALATQRAYRIQAPTYAFVGASTITTAATLSISGAPVAGTNATITNNYALQVEAGMTNLVGGVKLTNASTIGFVWTATDVNGNGSWQVSAGGGITNTAAANEIPKSNGTNIVPSGIFSTASGDIILGLSSAASSVHDISVSSSSANTSISLTTKGNGTVQTNGQFISFGGAGVSNAVLSTYVGTGTVNAPENSGGINSTSVGTFFTHTRNGAAGAMFIIGCAGIATLTPGGAVNITAGAGYNVGNTNGGDIVLAGGTANGSGTPGSVLVNSNFKINTVGNGLYIKEGANATMGVATLVAGTILVSTTKVTASSRIILTPQETGTLTLPARVSARVAGTSFTISAGGTDTAQIAWVIIEPA